MMIKCTDHQYIDICKKYYDETFTATQKIANDLQPPKKVQNYPKNFPTFTALEHVMVQKCSLE